jgi:hypothetical protein
MFLLFPFAVTYTVCYLWLEWVRGISRGSVVCVKVTIISLIKKDEITLFTSL